MGYTGSSWAALLCYAFMAVLCYYFGQKYYPIPYQVFRMLSYLIVTFIIAMLVNAYPIANPWLSHGFHLLVLTIYLAGVYIIERPRWKMTE